MDGKKEREIKGRKKEGIGRRDEKLEEEETEVKRKGR